MARPAPPFLLPACNSPSMRRCARRCGAVQINIIGELVHGGSELAAGHHNLVESHGTDINFRRAPGPWSGYRTRALYGADDKDISAYRT